MLKLKRRKILLISFAITFTLQVNAQWQATPTPNNLVNGTGLSSTDQKFPDITAYDDASYNSIYAICWQDRRAGLGHSDIYAQCYDSSGAVQWGANGLLICNASNVQLNPRIVADDLGNFYIAWEDQRSGGGNPDIYVQRVSAAGSVQWTSNGVLVATGCAVQTDIEMVALMGGSTDPTKGVVITWVDDRNGSMDIYAQRLDFNGAAKWTSNGIPVCIADGYQRYQKIVGNLINGFAIVWDEANGAIVSQDVYGQLLDEDGIFQWTNSLRGKLFSSGGCGMPEIVESGSDDYFIAWLEGSEPYYINRDEFGDPIGNDGYANNNIGSNARNIDMIPDRNGGAYICWDDDRNGNYDIYAQNIDNSGTVNWTSSGEQVCSDNSEQYHAEMAACNGTCYITWVDKRSTDEDIYYQSLDYSTGNLNLAAAGRALSNKNDDQKNQRMVIMHDKVVTVWDDYVNTGANGIDVFCSNFWVTACSPVTTTSVVVKDPATDINSPSTAKSASYSIYPNPVFGELTITHPTETIVSILTIITLDGKVVMEIKDFKVGDTIDVSDLAAGDYLIKLSGSSSAYSFRILKH